MRLRVLAPLALLLLLVAPASARLESTEATAAGTTSFVVTEGWDATVVCATNAAFAVDVSAAVGMTSWGGVGAVAWDAPGCGAHPDAAGASAFTPWCTDACFDECWWTTPDEVTCSSEQRLGDDGASDALTLRRDGAFTFDRGSVHDGVAYAVHAEGVLLVAAWPEASWQ